jgi:hypothetical protein
MAKDRYSVPVSLDRSILDHELSLSNKSFHMKPLPMKVIFTYVGSIVVLMWLLTGTPLKGSSFGFLALITIWWIAATAYFAAYSKTKEMRMNQIGALLDYVPKKSRRVLTRSDSRTGPFQSIVGIQSVDESTGLITYVDGMVGQAYSVVGSASRLLFDQDRDAILNRNDRFYRKLEPGVEWVFVTTKEPQRVYAQVAALEKRNQALPLEARDPELVALMDEQYESLRSYVGSSFFSIHQYLILIARNEEELRKAHNLLDSEAADSSLMFKQVSMLTYDETIDLLATHYGPVAMTK